jgi:succinoglycan biosynthesis transport protein ExoP
VLVVASTLVFSFLQTPLYESTARLLIRPINQTAGTVAPVLPNLETERGLVASAPVAERVAQSLELREDPRSLLDGLSVDVVAGAEFLVIHYRHPDPIEAHRRARAFANEYLNFRRQQAVDEILAASVTVRQRIEALESRLADLEARIADAAPSRQAALASEAGTIEGQIAVLQVQLSELIPPAGLNVGQVVEPASVPDSPTFPNHSLNIALALFVGLALGVGLAFLRERLDDRIRGREDLEAQAGASALAVIPRVANRKRREEARLVTHDEPRSAPSEAYRKLRTSLLFSASQREMRSLLVTSPHVEEGKTTTVSNLGVALAQAGKRVILIDADLRKPKLHEFFSLNGQVGLTNVLAGEADLWEAAVQSHVDNLSVLPSGPIPGNPAELLSSDQMGALLEELSKAAEFLVIDSAPVLVAADATILATLVDGVLLVADAGKTSRGSVGHARIQLDQVSANVVGAVLNNFDFTKAQAYKYYYQYYYVSRPEPEEPRRRLLRPASPRPAEPGSREIRSG